MMGDLRYCFEQSKVLATLARTKKQGLAVIDTDGIDSRKIQAEVRRGVLVYGYLNAGALEKERLYYHAFKHLRLAKYDGWDGEYWIDPTAREWHDHLLDVARAIKAAGGIGIYFDNADIYYQVRHIKQEYSRPLPAQTAVYRALAQVVIDIVNETGLVVMPNGGDAFVRRFCTEYPRYLHTINQEGALYEDFRKQPKSERKFRAEYMDWARKKGLYVRGIEYCKKASQIAECKAYYAVHGWQGLYVSKHKNLEGD